MPTLRDAIPEDALAIAGVHVRAWQAAYRGLLYALYVDPPHWRTGTGRLLLEAATGRMRADGFAEAVLWVLRGNQVAERFYAAAGWRRDSAERWEQPYGIVSNVLRMRRALA